MAGYLIPISPNQTVLTDTGLVNVGGLVWTYQANTLIPQATYTDSTLGSANSNPIELTSAGRFPHEVWVASGVTLKMVYLTAASVPLTPSVYDNIAALNDVTVSSTLSEWQLGTTPTYGGTTSFTVAGDKTSLYTQGRRIKATVTAGVVYGTITNAVFTTVTTVTLRMDSTVLDSGLSSVSYGLFDPQHPSYKLETTYADAAGTANALTATFYGPDVAIVDGANYQIDAAYANTSKNVTLTLTLNTVAQTTYPILKGNGQLLTAGDIQVHHVLNLTFITELAAFVLGNPANGIIGESVSVSNNIGNATGATTIDISNGDAVYGTLTGTCTFTFSNPAPTGFTQSFTLELTNGEAFVITWPASVKWSSASKPVLTAAGKDVLVFSTRDAGTTWLGFLVGRNMS